MYITDRALLHGLAPNIVVSQDVCDVCAVNADSAACDIPPGAELVLLTAISIDGLVADITMLAASLGAPDRGEAVVAEVRSGLALSRGVAAVPEGGGNRGDAGVERPAVPRWTLGARAR